MIAARIGFYGLLAWLLTVALPGQSSGHPATVPPLDGYWKGPLKLPGGQLEVIFRLVKLTDGEYFATLDVPLQKVTQLAVTVTTRNDTIFLASVQANSHYTGRLSADGKQLLGTWQQPGFKAPLTLTYSALPAQTAKLATRLTPPYREEEVTFSNATAKLRLAGTLTVPAGKGPFPAVALLSDAGSQDRNGTVGDFAPLGQLADYLTRRGIAVLRFDDRGTGQSTGAPQASTTELVSDAQAALTFLRTRPEIDFAHLGLLGHGEGGNVALLAATQPLPPTFVIGLAPYGLTGSEIALKQQETMLRSMQMDPDQLAATLKRQQAMFEIIKQTATASQAQAIVANMLRQNNTAIDEATAQASAAEMVAPRYRTYLTFNPVENLFEVACPVLLLFGTADLTLDTDTNLGALLKSLKGTTETILARKLPGVNHLFQPDPDQWPIVSGEAKPTFSPVAQEAIRAWVVEQAAK